MGQEWDPMRLHGDKGEMPALSGACQQVTQPEAGHAQAAFHAKLSRASAALVVLASASPKTWCVAEAAPRKLGASW